MTFSPSDWAARCYTRGGACARHVACSKRFTMRPPVLVMFERLQPIARPVCLVCALSVAALVFATYLSFVLRGFPMDW
jgi:hypothetical protein